MGLLGRLYERHAQKLKDAKEFGEFRYESGAVAAIEEMANAADQVVLKMEELHDRAARTAEQRRLTDAARTRVLADSHWSNPTGL